MDLGKGSEETLVRCGSAKIYLPGSGVAEGEEVAVSFIVEEL